MNTKKKRELLKAILSGDKNSALEALKDSRPFKMIETSEDSDVVKYEGKEYSYAEFEKIHAKIKRTNHITHVHLSLTYEGTKKGIPDFGARLKLIPAEGCDPIIEGGDR